MNRRTFLCASIAAIMDWRFRVHAADISVGTGIEPLWEAAIITDTHTSRWDWISALVGKLKEGKPRMLIHTGDTNFDRPGKLTMKAAADFAHGKRGGLEFHLAPGNHDMRGGALKSGLRRAATQGIFRAYSDAGFRGEDYFKVRQAGYTPGPIFGAWNPEVPIHSGWRSDSNAGGISLAGIADPLHFISAKFFNVSGVDEPCRYVFQRGGIRFIVCDWAYSKGQREWLRRIVTQDDGSSASVVLHHGHYMSKLRRYFDGLEGRHNVKLVLSGHAHRYRHEKRDGITYITGAGIALGNRGECDAMMLRVYRDYLRLDRYVIPKRSSEPTVLGPEPIWVCKGKFRDFRKPASSGGAPSYVKIPDSENKVFYQHSK